VGLAEVVWVDGKKLLEVDLLGELASTLKDAGELWPVEVMVKRRLTVVASSVDTDLLYIASNGE
jgi:hypothetical protein